MPATTKVPLGASTLNRKWYLDVNTGTSAAPVWVGIFGITDMKPIQSPNLAEDSDYDSDGWESQIVTAQAWGLELKVKRAVTAASATAYDPGQEFLRLAAIGMGTANKVEIRYYEMTNSGPQIEAYQGFVSVSWEPEGGDMKALDTASVKLTSMGKRNSIAHPAGSPAPVISLLAPTAVGVAGGTLVTATGNGFTGATALTIGGTAVAAADWTVVNDGKIVFKTLAKSAGQYDVIVTTPGGSSATSANTKLTYS